MKKWNVVTFKNGEQKDHYWISIGEATCEDVALWFDLKYNGDEGEVLEIIPIEQ